MVTLTILNHLVIQAMGQAKLYSYLDGEVELIVVLWCEYVCAHIPVLKSRHPVPWQQEVGL